MGVGGGRLTELMHVTVTPDGPVATTGHDVVKLSGVQLVAAVSVETINVDVTPSS